MRIKPTLELLCMVDALAGRHTRVAYVQGELAAAVAKALRASK